MSVAGEFPPDRSIYLVAQEASYLGVGGGGGKLGDAVTAAARHLRAPTVDEVYGNIRRPLSTGLRMLRKVTEGETYETAGLFEPEELSPLTVRDYINRVAICLNARTRTEAARRSVEVEGLLPMLELRHYRRLSPAEIFTLSLLSHGWRNIEIAERFRLTSGIVDQYATDAYEKLECNGPLSTVRVALSVGALLPDYRIIQADRPQLPTQRRR